MNGTYTNREGEKWKLTDLRPVPFAPGFWHGYRENKQLVVVHEHRLVLDAVVPPQEVAK